MKSTEVQTLGALPVSMHKIDQLHRFSSCLPDGNATIMKGTCRQISLSSNAFRSDSSSGI